MDSAAWQGYADPLGVVLHLMYAHGPQLVQVSHCSHLAATKATGDHDGTAGPVHAAMAGQMEALVSELRQYRREVVTGPRIPGGTQTEGGGDFSDPALSPGARPKLAAQVRHKAVDDIEPRGKGPVIAAGVWVDSDLSLEHCRCLPSGITC
jgi:hypothetical protein